MPALDELRAGKPPVGIRLMHALGKEPDWDTISPEQLAVLRTKENRKRQSKLARLITGFPDRGAGIEWRELALPGRRLPVRVYRPMRHQGGELPLIVHIHGGGFVGTAAQSDWVNSYLAAQLPALVVSVEHRLLAHDTAITAGVDDGWDVLQTVVENAAEWGVDSSRIAVFGESTGGLIAAVAAIRARESGLQLRAQVLVNACVDLTTARYDLPSMSTYADSPTLTTAQIELFCRLAVPEGIDPRPLSPLQADDLSGLPPALLIVPTFDPVSDQARRYAARLRNAGIPAQLTEYEGATHAFLSMPAVVPQAKPARAEILEYLSARLAD
ncbi:alpha/beta hydrolase [Kribbella sp. NBC_00709]|uniref:alpha/beta hydrolase n=1 Tax=Kribbella sp. NBC_00709 TaxID=2975972 RepID=UPI002E2BA09F|nr:alpha/beta hydrolase [Kribbella sp. NBC_00709]